MGCQLRLDGSVRESCAKTRHEFDLPTEWMSYWLKEWVSTESMFRALCAAYCFEALHRSTKQYRGCCDRRVCTNCFRARDVEVIMQTA
eukprot:6202813-Pleurochrysis_carterae.AAC.2